MANIIRPASIDDLPEIQRIVREAYVGYVGRIGKPPAPMLDDYRRHILAHEAWVMLNETDVAGVLILIPHAGYLLLDNVAVDPRFRGKGMGRALIEFAEHETARRGYEEIRLFTHQKMYDNFLMYPRCGYEETGRGIQDGFDRVFFRKPIADMTCTVLLVRHGETEWNRGRRYQGWLDSPLTPDGIAQAEAIGRRLRLVPQAAGAEIVASPLGRARRTAEIVAARLCDPRSQPQPIRFDERLREISLGSWDGLDRREIRRRAPELFTGEGGRWEWYFQTPDGETFDRFAERIAAWLADLGDAPVIAVAHGVVTRVLRGLYAGLTRAELLRLPVPQDRIFLLAGGTIAEIMA